MAVEDIRIFSFSATSASFLNNGSKFSNVTFQIPKFVSRHSDSTSVYISIENATIPSSWYNVPDGTSISFLRVDTNTTSTYTIPGGNYDAYTLCTVINTNWTDLTAANFKFVYNLQSNRIGVALTVSWLGTPIWYKFTVSNAFIFGSDGNYLSVWKNTLLTTTNFPLQMNLTGVSVYLFVCDECPTQNYSLQLAGNIIGSIQNAAANFGVTIWQNNTNLRYLIPINRQIDQITIRVYNERGELIDFNSVPWNLTLKVTYYKTSALKVQDLQQFVAEINAINQSANQQPAQPASVVPATQPDAPA